jgi:hypothetical protein
MDEDDLFAGSMEIDDPAGHFEHVHTNGNVNGSVRQPAPARVDEDMSEVAEIMLKLKVRACDKVPLLCCSSLDASEGVHFSPNFSKL